MFRMMGWWFAVTAVTNLFCLPIHGQVKGPIVGKAVRSDVSKPLRELAAEAQRQKQQKEPATAAEGAAQKWLEAKHPAALTNGQLVAIEHEILAKTLPEVSLYALRFRQWPVAFEVPEGFQPSNLCAVKGDRVTLITSTKKLTEFVQREFKTTVDDENRRMVAATWLLLAQELHQDGFYKFKSIEPAEFQLEEGSVTSVNGKIDVDPQGGNQGQIEATLTFDKSGKLTGAKETTALKEGVRPICQATKLLDTDSIVRRMAERDILVMGSLSRSYLIEQWQQASPELQNTIESLWQRIGAEGR